MLEIKNVSIALGGERLFEGLSFRADEGQIVCVTGDSGCGKTTLLRAILGFLPLAEGHISIDGELLTNVSAVEFRKTMAYVPQDLGLPTEWVRDLVCMPFLLKANSAVGFSKEKLLGEWKKLGLEPELYDKKVSELSGGQRQRIMISLSGLLGKPIILADEPTSALDQNASALVLAYFRELAGRGTIIIAVSHDERLAAGCDKQITIGNN